MPAGFLLGIVHDRRLMREAQVNIAVRCFIGCGLHEGLPDHSSPAGGRQRRGGASDGAKRTGGSMIATAGDRKGSAARPGPGAGWAAPCSAAWAA